MIRIDHISFEFVTADEPFAHTLYANWDYFCRTCFEKIVEESLSVYDEDRMLHEIEKLDLDLGSIPQEEFYLEFPRRLREELLKVLPSLQLGQAEMKEVKGEALRFANLLYYLEHGVLKTEWADIAFNLSEELGELLMRDKRYMEKITGLCMVNEHALRRLLLQADDDVALVCLYSIAMDRSLSVKDEKRRFMEIFLEILPDLPVRFVHEVEEDGRLHGMAELLDTHSVRRLMEKETEEHAEVNLPPYWHYLYEWLIKYYPFNGLAIFGGKSNFIDHLHYRLLTFIHKRNNRFYLSKTELTASFLLEVFGAAYYKEVLNAIYNMQPRNADGSPAYDSYYNRELYHIFMQLSLLNIPDASENKTDVNSSKEEIDSLLMVFRLGDLSVMLKDAGRNEANKRMILAGLVQQKSEELITWLRSEAGRNKDLIVVMASLIDESILLRLLASVSLVAMETVDEVIRLLKNRTDKMGLLHEVSDEQLNFTLRKVVLSWIGNNRPSLSKQEMIEDILLLVCSEATGRNKNEISKGELIALLYHTDKDTRKSILLYTDFSELSVLLKDARRSEADKKLLIGLLIQEKPDVFVSWLKIEVANDDACMIILAGLIDESILLRLLASVSLVAMETVDEVLRLLKNRTDKMGLLHEVSDEQLNFTLRKAVLLWIKENGYELSTNEGTKSLLEIIHKEATATSKGNKLIIEEWAEVAHLFKSETKGLLIFAGQNDTEIKESIRRLRMILTGGNVAEIVKRRLVVSFLEQQKNRYTEAILKLHEEGLLEDALSLISLSATESVIRQMVVPYMGANEAEKLLLLMNRLFANEHVVSVYLKDKSLTLKTQLLVWLAKEKKVQTDAMKSCMKLLFASLTFLFGKEKVSAVVRLVVYEMTGEVSTDQMKGYDSFEVIDLFPYIGSFGVHRAMSVFEQWSQNMKEHSKHELLQTLVWEKPQELIETLRNLTQNEETIPLMAAHISVEVLLDVTAKKDAKQSLLLSRTIDLLQREQRRFAFLSTMTLSFTTALSEALLLFMQDNDTLGGRNLTEQEVVGKFLSKLYYVYTRRTDYDDHAEWKYLQDEVTNGVSTSSTEVPAPSEESISEKLLSEYGSLDDSELHTLIIVLLNKQPEQFIALFENKANEDLIKRISCIADRAILSQIISTLSFANGFEVRAALRRLMEWLSITSANHTSTSNMVSALLSWISTTNWRRQTVRQMTLFFISRMYGSDDTGNWPLKMLTDDTLPEEVRKQLLRNYMRSSPKELLRHIKQLAAEGTLPMNKWTQWADISEWLRLAASVSLTLEELLRQVIDYFLSQSKPVNETTLIYALVTFVTTNDTMRFTYDVDKTEIVRSFILSLPAIQKKISEEKEETISQVMKNLGITNEEERALERNEKDDLEIAIIGNAGLCLLAPWFPRLFTMLGYLDEEKRNFKDTTSKVRAVFLLQYLFCPENKDYRETELFFNRLLVALPANIPLPKQIELTDEEKQTADNMLEGVKANWRKMEGTSVSGFRQSFIVRNGRLEQQDEKWLLTVESRVYDILLDAVPWAFRQIRFPWLKKYVQVFWHEKQEF